MNLSKSDIGKNFTADPTGVTCFYDNVYINTEPCEDDGTDYIDVYVDGKLAYMVGESCKLIKFDDRTVTLCNDNNNIGEEEFTITKKHFDLCFA